MSECQVTNSTDTNTLNDDRAFLLSLLDLADQYISGLESEAVMTPMGARRTKLVPNRVRAKIAKTVRFLSAIRERI